MGAELNIPARPA